MLAAWRPAASASLILLSSLSPLLGKKVIDVAAGSTHCLALTEDSEVHSWGSNDQCQHFDTLRVTKPEPTALPGLDTKHIVGIACGPAQVTVPNASPGTTSSFEEH